MPHAPAARSPARARWGLVLFLGLSLAATAQASPTLTVAPGGWFSDAFPANETPEFPGSAGFFDTCAAHVRTGINIAQKTGNNLRFNIPGDSLVATVSGGGADPDRVDLVFRIFPGPGNYVTVGAKGTGLRRVPTSTTPVTAGDPSFWGQYLADEGTFGSASGHVGDTWNPDVWMSARCDTAERNLFPVDGLSAGLSGLTAGAWMSTYHEADPKYGTLGIVKNRCFLVDTLGVPTSPNITCNSVPAWLEDADLAARAGYDGSQQTREFTRIIPDGLLTPGSHVEYFLRRSTLAAPDSFVMNPDTNYICPQPGPDLDGHRWQEFSILPDRWKGSEYGGEGDACILVLDYDDGGGDERVFIGLADSLDLTVAAKRGAHNGWHCTSAYMAPDGTRDYTGRNVGALGQYDASEGMHAGKITIWKHGGCPGTAFDLYQVRACDGSDVSANGVGARLANRSDMGLAEGKWGRQAPTPEMLRAYYKMIILLSGSRNAGILGPRPDRGSNDAGILEDFLGYNAGVENPRGLWVMGNGFAESEWTNSGHDPTLLTEYMGCFLRDPSYCALSGNLEMFPDLTPTSVITTGGEVFSVHSGTGTGCAAWTNDVLELTGVPGVLPGSYYEDFGSAGPYIAGIYGPSVVGHPYVTLLDGFDLKDLRTRGGDTSFGRLEYVASVTENGFGSVCPFSPNCLVAGPCIDVPQPPATTTDFLGAAWGNPMAPGGRAIVHFALARADRATVKVYDMAGRLVRILADRDFPAGEHALSWDGRGDDGRALRPGVYFTRVRYRDSGFAGTKKLTLLR